MLKTQKIQFALTAVISASVGGAASILVFAKIQEAKFQERLDREISDAKAYYQEMYSTPVFERIEEDDEPSPGIVVNVHTNGDPAEDLVGKALDAARDYRPDPDEDADVRVPTTVNLFQNHTAPGEEVLAALMKDRDPAEPYIITREEFYSNEPDHEQQQFTYWEGDAVLVDDREELMPIDDTERVAGDENLLRFGYGSGDENVLYIRNETLDPPLDLHITRSSGKYAVEVMAMDDDGPHLQHSQPRKFRIRDE